MKSNVLLEKINGCWNARLTDFGSCKLRDYGIENSTAMTNLRWSPPEITKLYDDNRVKKPNMITDRWDIWSFGCTMLEVTCLSSDG